MQEAVVLVTLVYLRLIGIVQQNIKFMKVFTYN